MVECRLLQYNLLSYIVSNSYCPESVVDFYDKMVCDIPMGQMTVNYKGWAYTLNNALIGRAHGIPPRRILVNKLRLGL